ncbi:MAG: fasciclin domain-containing protein [Deltaproteobacteria bacterium]|nr:fasciclin domain-containing protein [Deltaproteobacteria bacterium]
MKHFLKFTLLACTLGLAACSSDSDDDSTADDGSGAMGGDAAAPGDIVAVAQAAGSFETLVAAVTAADLVETLQGPGPFTVFAPTDDAFAALPAGTVDDLLKPENKAQLTAVLTYHVVAGKVTAADVVKLSDAKTVQGANVEIATMDGKVMINDATVVTADVMAKNGVIHVIDKVLLPPQ